VEEIRYPVVRRLAEINQQQKNDLSKAFTTSEVKRGTSQSIVCQLSAEKYQDFLEQEKITSSQYSIPWRLLDAALGRKRLGCRRPDQVIIF
jgi:hypothetical protein